MATARTVAAQSCRSSDVALRTSSPVANRATAPRNAPTAISAARGSCGRCRATKTAAAHHAPTSTPATTRSAVASSARVSPSTTKHRGRDREERRGHRDRRPRVALSRFVANARKLERFDGIEPGSHGYSDRRTTSRTGMGCGARRDCRDEVGEDQDSGTDASTRSTGSARGASTTPRSSATQPHTTRPTIDAERDADDQADDRDRGRVPRDRGAHLPTLVPEGLEDGEVAAASTYGRHEGVARPRPRRRRPRRRRAAPGAVRSGSAGRSPSASRDRSARIPHRPSGGAPDARDRHRSPAPSEPARSRRSARCPLSSRPPRVTRRPRPVAAGRRSGSAGTRSDRRSGTGRSRPTSPPARSPRVAFPAGLERRSAQARPRALSECAARDRSPARRHHGSPGTCSRGPVGRRSRCRRNRATIPHATIGSRSNDCVGPHALSSASTRVHREVVPCPAVEAWRVDQAIEARREQQRSDHRRARRRRRRRSRIEPAPRHVRSSLEGEADAGRHRGRQSGPRCGGGRECGARQHRVGTNGRHQAASAPTARTIPVSAKKAQHRAPTRRCRNRVQAPRRARHRSGRADDAERRADHGDEASADRDRQGSADRGAPDLPPAAPERRAGCPLRRRAAPCGGRARARSRRDPPAPRPRRGSTGPTVVTSIALCAPAPSIARPSVWNLSAPPKILRADAMTPGTSAAPCFVRTRSTVPEKLPISSRYSVDERTRRHDHPARRAATPEVERPPHDAHDPEGHRGAFRCEVLLDDLVDLLGGERLEGETISDLHAELAREAFADRELVDRMCFPPGDETRPIDTVSERVVEGPGGREEAGVFPEDRELPERADGFDVRRALERPKLFGGCLPRVDLDIGRGRGLFEARQRRSGAARAGDRTRARRRRRTPPTVRAPRCSRRGAGDRTTPGGGSRPRAA